MGKILDKFIAIFRKKTSVEKEEEFQQSYQKLKYTGLEPLCFACQYPIHETQRSKRIDGKRMHSDCFKELKKLILAGKGQHGL